ncbi:hypothetical protein JK182_01330 [Acetobacter okinawensis]|uniref:hypothetical protein n=1 Tax=Acetobacter okinawensis TaxID=1076594 RepID=UPI001BA883C3|nr:hypothetical protein [Acetobacter okinawensis]MBS0987334.1 hypothetical protein [Acetobacter okinawensis]
MKNYPYEKDGELLIDTTNVGTIKLNDLEEHSEIMVDGNITINDNYKGETLPDIIADGHIFIQDNTSISEISYLSAKENVNISGNSLICIERIEAKEDIVIEDNEFLEVISAVSGQEVYINGDNIKSLNDHTIGISFPIKSKGDLTINCPELKEIGSIECGGNAFITGPSCIGKHFDPEKKLNFTSENHVKGDLKIHETTIGECENFTIGGDFNLVRCANLDDTISEIRCDGTIDTNGCSLSFSNITANKIDLSGDLISVTDAKAHSIFESNAEALYVSGLESPIVSIDDASEFQAFDNVKADVVSIQNCGAPESIDNLEVGSSLTIEECDVENLDVTFTGEKSGIFSSDLTSLGDITGREIILETPELTSLGSLDVDSIDISECNSLSESEIKDIEESVETVKKNTALKM